MIPHRFCLGRRDLRAGSQISWWIKLPYTALVSATVLAYGVSGQLTMLLWFSDMALIGIAVAMWLASRLLASMMALVVLLPELGWTAAFIAALILGEAPLGQRVCERSSRPWARPGGGSSAAPALVEPAGCAGDGFRARRSEGKRSHGASAICCRALQQASSFGNRA